jgi:hypothetical protein
MSKTVKLPFYKEAGIKDLASKAVGKADDFVTGLSGSRLKKLRHKSDVLNKSLDKLESNIAEAKREHTYHTIDFGYNNDKQKELSKKIWKLEENASKVKRRVNTLQHKRMAESRRIQDTRGLTAGIGGSLALTGAAYTGYKLKKNSINKEAALKDIPKAINRMARDTFSDDRLKKIVGDDIPIGTEKMIDALRYNLKNPNQKQIPVLDKFIDKHKTRRRDSAWALFDSGHLPDHTSPHAATSYRPTDMAMSDVEQAMNEIRRTSKNKKTAVRAGAAAVALPTSGYITKKIIDKNLNNDSDYDTAEYDKLMYGIN